MLEADLLVSGGGDGRANTRQVARFVRNNFESQRARVNQRETVAAIRHIDRQRAVAFHFKRRVQTLYIRWYVVKLDAPGFAALAEGAHLYQPGRRFQAEAGFRLLHGDHAAVQQHGGDANRIRAGHRRRVLGLHDDEAPGGIWVLRRYKQVNVLEYAAARLVQDKTAQGLIVRDPARLLPDCFARGRGHAADDDIADLAFGMTRNQMY